jgi:hypothetical protein
MGRHTPPLTGQALEEYLKNHLNNELQWLLRAATEWYAQETVKLNIEGYHVEVYAMDSVFLHARTLFEFFTKTTSDNYYGYDIFGISPTPSPLYNRDWGSTLHSYGMHAQDRSQPQQLMAFDGTTTKDLNKMPLDFAKEIVRLWREFIVLLGQHSNPAIKALEQVAIDSLDSAINAASEVTKNKMLIEYHIAPINW